MLLVAGLTILSPAYLHFTHSGPEFAAALPDAPDNPHSDALCDKIYATYQSQIQNLQSERSRIAGRLAKGEGDAGSAKADMARLEAEASDISTQGLQVRDDCYVKVANWQTDQKTSRKPGGATAAPATFAASPAPAPVAPTASQPMQLASATPSGPPARAYAVYAPPPAAKTAPIAAETATSLAPTRHHRARHARSGMEYASLRRRSRRSEEGASLIQADYPVSEPRVAVGAYDKILVPNADGVVRIPADGVTGVERIASAKPAHRALRLASASTHRRSRLHHGVVRVGYRPQESHHALTVASVSSAKAYAPASASYIAVSVATSTAPTSSTMAISAPRTQTVAPTVVGRTTSGLDPPSPDRP